VSLDADTALEPLGDGRRRAAVRELWSRDGALLGQSRDLAMIRGR
jgi:hypothetical protein